MRQAGRPSAASCARMQACMAAARCKRCAPGVLRRPCAPPPGPAPMLDSSLLLWPCPAHVFPSPGAAGKFAVLARMLEVLRASTKERIVIVSNYTQTLDLVAQVGERAGGTGQLGCMRQQGVGVPACCRRPDSPSAPAPAPSSHCHASLGPLCVLPPTLRPARPTNRARASCAARRGTPFCAWTAARPSPSARSWSRSSTTPR